MKQVIIKRIALLAILALPLGACQTTRPPITTEPHVELSRFMGDWYVIANIPTFIETKAYNAIESYRLESDGTIDTVFTFNKGAFDGPKKRYNPHGFVVDTQSNAVWGMRFVWPFKSDYRIVYLDSAYSQTIIGRQSRDYVWIMARTPTISDADYQRLLDLVKQEGYDLQQIRKVPQMAK